MQPGGGNDPYRENSVNGSSFSRTSADLLGTGTPPGPPWRSGEYVPVNMLYISSKVAICSSFHLMKQYFPYGQGGINHSGFPVVTEQVSNAMNFSHPFPGTSAPQNNQGATPVWQLSDLNWVNYEAQGELHLTIVFRKVPFA
jgi:hypothetical protein